MRYRKSKVAIALSIAVVCGVIGATIGTAAGPRQGRTELSGYQEIPTLSTPAHGNLEVTISPDENSLSYTLTYSGFETDVLQSHIHLGRPAFNGGIMLYLCTNLTPPAGVPLPPSCPTRAGTVTGELTMADVFGGASGQGIALGDDFSKVVDALREEASYGNVHSTARPGGEIRGQVLFHAIGAAIR
jgi:CHRD domain-containing protein